MVPVTSMMMLLGFSFFLTQCSVAWLCQRCLGPLMMICHPKWRCFSSTRWAVTSIWSLIGRLVWFGIGASRLSFHFPSLFRLFCALFLNGDDEDSGILQESQSMLHLMNQCGSWRAWCASEPSIALGCVHWKMSSWRAFESCLGLVFFGYYFSFVFAVGVFGCPQESSFLDLRTSYACIQIMNRSSLLPIVSVGAVVCSRLLSCRHPHADLHSYSFVTFTERYNAG